MVRVPLSEMDQANYLAHSGSIHTQCCAVEATANGEEAKGRVQCTVKLIESIPDILVARRKQNAPGNSCIIELKTIEAQGLAMKDVNFLGIKTGSDPYAFDFRGLVATNLPCWGKPSYLPHTVTASGTRHYRHRFRWMTW
jgi:hypothetical protein